MFKQNTCCGSSHIIKVDRAAFQLIASTLKGFSCPPVFLSSSTPNVYLSTGALEPLNYQLTCGCM